MDMIELTRYLIATFKEVWKKGQEMREDSDQCLFWRRWYAHSKQHGTDVHERGEKQEWIKLISHGNAKYQAGYLWQESESDLDLPDPKLWGWTFDENRGLIPCWLTATSTIDLEKFVTTCSCKTGKCERCKCANAGISCIRMCGCNRICEQKKEDTKNEKKGRKWVQKMKTNQDLTN